MPQKIVGDFVGAKVKVTQKNVMSLPDGVYKIEPDFYLRVRGESRLFFVRFTLAGRRIDRACGSARKTPLSAARARARAVLADAAGGRDSARENVPSVRLREFLPDATEKIGVAHGWKATAHTKRYRLQLMRDYVLPELGSMFVQDVGREDILRVISPLWGKSHELARMTAKHLKMCFDLAKMSGLRSGENPALWKGGLSVLFSTRSDPVRHQPAPTLEELRGFCAFAMKYSDNTKLQEVLFTILTACRRDEVRLARPEEIDLAAATFTIPPERRKDCLQVPFVVPLPNQALSIARAFQARKESYLFPGVKPGKPLCNRAGARALQAFCKHPVTLHGCRSTFRDWAAQTGRDAVAAELCLMHKVGTQTQRAYFRSDLLDARRDLLLAWADVLCL